MNVARPLYTAFLMSIIPLEHRGKTSSILGIARRIAIIPGRSIGGYLLEIKLRATIKNYSSTIHIRSRIISNTA